MPSKTGPELSKVLASRRGSFAAVLSAPAERSRRVDLSPCPEASALAETLAAQLPPGCFGVGCYLEDRQVYRSRLFNPGDQEPRTIHLGVDLWLPAGSPVFAPLEGLVHSLGNNDKGLDYGGTVILRHDLDGCVFHTLYGHLAWNSLAGLREGGPVTSGQQLGLLGTPEQNGGWEPHLHFQIIEDMEGKRGDYFGVAQASRLEWYARNCPDPQLILGALVPASCGA